MNGNCLEIGVIQGFLDGELPHNEIDRVSSHIAVCDSCALSLATAEEEIAVVFPALEREMDSLVPTQRLWAKIDAEIKNGSSRTGWWASLSSLFASPSFAAACGLILVVAIGATVFLNRGTTTPSTMSVASNVQPTATAPLAGVPVSSVPDTIVDPRPTLASSTQTTRPTAIKASYEAPRSAPVFRPMAAAVEPLAGEESYVRTIATLSKDVEGQKDLVLRPSERIAYERDMAVVNDTIDKMRKAVKKNPRNESAKQVLYSSYQNKINLLNSVTQREELFASVR
ncbi:MAG TPA: zf-HC2 domain-containing protein [Pyrinomonadaceae bacterium]|nr:zf-HC2 domain-containing protein [Pyrinomonadaceae bacterium]